MFQSTSVFPSRSTIPRFSGKNGAVNFTSREAIELADLERIAPSVFADGKHESRSDRYVYIPTRDVLGALVKEGFRPYSVLQGGSRDASKRGFTKHLIRFRHESTSVVRGSHHTEICLLNSHDGTSSYRLFAGVFRLVCSNGLVVSEGDIAEVRVSHSGSVTDKVVEGFHSVLDSLPEVNDRIAEFSALELSAGERRALATAALVARYDGEASPVTPEQALSVRRSADAGGDAWSTLNVLQENLVRGGLGYVQRDANGRRVANRSTRAVNSVDGNVGLNRALWTLTSELAKLKTA